MKKALAITAATALITASAATAGADNNKIAVTASAATAGSVIHGLTLFIGASAVPAAIIPIIAGAGLSVVTLKMLKDEFNIKTLDKVEYKAKRANKRTYPLNTNRWL